MACIYGAAALSLPADVQMALYSGRRYAKAVLQELHWDTRRDLSKSAVIDVYTTLRDRDTAMDIAASMDRAEKEGDAKRRLEDS